MTPNSTLSGRYQIVAEIGRGGMGIVFKGLDLRLGGDVAIKVVRTDRVPVSSPSWLQYAQDLVTEGRRLVQLRGHQSIVTVYDVDLHEGQPYVVMQLCTGHSLEHTLRVEGAAPASTTLVRSVASCIGSALQFAHDRGFLHCDVKPANILMPLNGVPLLTDFGIARVSRDLLGARTPGFSGYTLAYASPEQVTGREVGPASDQYSLAVILYEMVTNRRLVAGGSSDEEKQWSVVQEMPPPPSELNPQVPADLDVVLMRALSKQSERRYPSIGEFSREVLRALDDQTTRPALGQPEDRSWPAATVTDPPERETQPRRSRAPRFAMVGAGVAVLAAWVLYGCLSGGAPGDGPPPPPPPPEPNSVAVFVCEGLRNETKPGPVLAFNAAAADAVLADGKFEGLHEKGVVWPQALVASIDPMADGQPDLSKLMAHAREQRAEFLLYGRLKATTPGVDVAPAGTGVAAYRWNVTVEFTLCRLVDGTLEILPFQRRSDRPPATTSPDKFSDRVWEWRRSVLKDLAKAVQGSGWVKPL